MLGSGEGQFLSFPFSIEVNGPKTSTRAQHVREQIEQLLFTSPKERVYRPEFGVGIRNLLFEPNNATLLNITHKQLLTSLADALHGEVDPRTLEVDISQEDGQLLIQISYMLAAINKEETQMFTIEV